MAVYSQIITWGLIAVHWVTLYLDILLNLAKKTGKAVIEAHKPSRWLFSERNAVPWSKKTANTNQYSYPIVYYPEETKFSVSVRNGDGVKGSFSDVVTAQLVNSDRILSFDMTSFFHEASWEGGAPSLYEVVLVYFLSNDTLFVKDSMKGFCLEVFTAEGKEYSINISCNAAVAPFAGWELFDEVTTSVTATGSASATAERVQEVVEDEDEDAEEDKDAEAETEA
jgi:hypothetical protein